MENKPIVLNVKSSSNTGVIRLSDEAEKVVRRLQKQSGLPVKTIVSEIVIQAENLIRLNFEEEDEE